MKRGIGAIRVAFFRNRAEDMRHGTASREASNESVL